MSTPELKFSKPRPYKIEIPEEEVQRVKQYAELARLDVIQAKVLEQEPKDAMEYGLQPSKLIPLIEHLKSGYDWRKEEAEMNALGEHYMITLSGIPDQGELDMHVVVRKSGKKGAIPLLLAHGWPGSFFEFRKLAPLLTEGSPAFDLVMPSLPGFTFSAPPRRGPEGSRVPWTNTKLGLCADAAMRAFGYDRYVAQGGDVGSVVARRCAQLFPERCRSIHLNFLPVPEEANDSMSADEKRGNQRGKEFFQFGAAYAAMQGTTPYTLGAVLALSPLSTIAYLAEKWYRWSSPDKPPSLDEVLTNSLLYYYTGSTTSSF